MVFLIKAVVAGLKAFPHFNASLSPDGQTLIRKKYFHIRGVAVDTPNGLMVPVLRDCDTKGLIELSQELTDLSSRAREGKLKGDEMKGGCFSISSLGGIGGTAFTPIINAPELAILGVSRAAMKPVWDGNEFQPRLMLPLSLSYDHRVIDGADGGTLYPLPGRSARETCVASCCDRTRTVSDDPRQTGFGMMLVAALGLLGILTWFFSDQLDQRANPESDRPEPAGRPVYSRWFFSPTGRAISSQPEASTATR